MIIPAIKNRRSVRQFKTNPVPDQLIEEIIQAAEYAPSAHGSKAVEYMIVKDQAFKKEINQIFSAESRQEFIETAPVLIIPVVDTNKSVLPLQDLSVTSENIFLQAAELGLGSVWKNVNSKFVTSLLTLLKLGSSYALINIIPIGFPKETVVPHNENDFDTQKIKIY